MLFYCEETKNKNNFLRSMEKMVRVTYPDFEFEDFVYEKTADELEKEGYSLNDFTKGLFDWEDFDKMCEMAIAYRKTIDVGNPKDYEKDTIEYELALIKRCPEAAKYGEFVKDRKGLLSTYKKFFYD